MAVPISRRERQPRKGEIPATRAAPVCCALHIRMPLRSSNLQVKETREITSRVALEPPLTHIIPRFAIQRRADEGVRERW